MEDKVDWDQEDFRDQEVVHGLVHDLRTTVVFSILSFLCLSVQKNNR